MDWRDVLRRAAKTAVQAFVAAFPFAEIAQVGDLSTAGRAAASAVIAAGAAGAAVVWNAVQQWLASKGISTPAGADTAEAEIRAFLGDTEARPSA